MKKIVIIAVVAAAALAGVAFYSGMFSRTNAAQAAGEQQAAAGGRGGARQGGAGAAAVGRGGGRGQLTVELAPVTHAQVDRELAVVGNLIGDQTVSVVPKTAGRLQEITVKLHVRNIFRKLGVRNRVEAANAAARLLGDRMPQHNDD